MSRTDKTKPWRVRVAEHHPIEIHNHERGYCDLPPSPLHGALGVWTAGRCSWSDWYLNYDGCCHGCGCRMCTNYNGRRAARRRSRHESRRWARTVVSTGDWWSDQDGRADKGAYR
jgi:hypothetical protein